MGWIADLDTKAAAGSFGRWFRLDGSGHPKQRRSARLSTEIRAGLTTFFAMAYIVAVNAAILAESGGTCTCAAADPETGCDADVDYALCKAEVRRDLVTATAAVSALSSFCMGLLANLPVALAPGMGLNAYFTYTVVGRNGSGPVPYEVALTAIFVEGLIFFALALLGMRQWLARAIPRAIKLATGAGIGLFLTLIGLTYAEGVGLLVGSRATPMALAGCIDAARDPLTGQCPDAAKMRSPTMWLGIFCGGFLTVLLLLYRVRGAVVAGVVLVSIVSWPRGTPVTYFPDTPVGNDAFAFFRRVVDFHAVARTLNVQRWDVAAYAPQFGLALATFLYVDILDCTGTLYSMAHFAGVVDPATRDFEGSTAAYMVDALSISVGSLLGTSPVTAFVESGAGISEGGKTGIAAMVTGLCFFVSIFFAPIFASIPPWATGCVLIVVGSMMVAAITEINWKYLGDAVPAFVTIFLMPFTYSVANGLVGGICSYILINTIVWLVETISRGRAVPPNKHEKDPWSWSVPGGVAPPWLSRLLRGKRDFWRSSDCESGGRRGVVVQQQQQNLRPLPSPPGREHHGDHDRYHEATSSSTSASVSATAVDPSDTAEPEPKMLRDEDVGMSTREQTR